MANKKTARRALFSSVLALILCCCMLVGTTFAWFTDSVTSAGNKIQSGTLKIDLEMLVKENDAWTWKSIKESPTPIFNYDLWEPGYVDVKVLKIENEGNLALKWFAKFQAASELSILANVIDVYVNTSATQMPTQREDIESWTYAGTVADFVNTIETTTTGSLLPKGETGDIAYLGIALKMQESAGNEYQNLSIGGNGGFDIMILATQEMYEEDSFDEKYDEGSLYPEVSIDNVTKEDGVETSVKNDDAGVKVDIPADAPEGNYSLVVTDKDTKTDAEGNTTVSMDINLLKDGVKVSDGNTYTVSVKIGAGLNLTKLTHNGNEITVYEYNITTGVVSFTTTGFSPFTFTYVDAGKDASIDMEGYATLADAFAAAKEGDTITLLKDVEVANNETITIANGDSVVIDLNGHKISSTADKTGNQELFLVKGNLTVKNGSMEYTTNNNQGWGAMITIFDVTAGGVLNLDGVKAAVDGSDMSFIVHLNNWGEVTLNANGCEFYAPYVAVRAFNSGYDMNNITIKNTKVTTTTGRLFWVHNYTSEGKDDSTLNLDIYGNGNTAVNAKPIRFGFDGSTYYNLDGQQLVTATTLADVMAAAKNGNVIIDAEGANLGDFNYDGTFGNGTVLKNAKFTYVYGASVNGVATFENCEFVSDHSYSANFSDGSYTGKVIFNNCRFDGWNSFGEAITYVEMNNCTFDWNNPYSMLRFYQNAELNNCVFNKIDGIDTNKTGTVVKLNNCTGIEGKIYNNGTNKGTWIVNGADISDAITSW